VLGVSGLSEVQCSREWHDAESPLKNSGVQHRAVQCSADRIFEQHIILEKYITMQYQSAESNKRSGYYWQKSTFSLISCRAIRQHYTVTSES
jgi:hypothetical protein